MNEEFHRRRRGRKETQSWGCEKNIQHMIE